MKGAAHAGLVIITLTHHLTHDIQRPIRHGRDVPDPSACGRG